MAGHRNLSAPLRAAVDEYGMLLPGDSVAVGVSGGKDSVALLALLADLRRYHPSHFTLTAITLDPCFNGRETDYSVVADLCDRLEVPYLLCRTHLWEAVQTHGNEESPCSLCARLRRGILHRTATEAGCRVVALGHHQDDAAETVLMNLLSGSSFSCFSPKALLDRRGITLIRPLIYIAETEIAAYVRREGLPVVPSACPVDGCTNRQEMKNLIAGLSGTYGDVSRKLIDSLKKSGISGW